MLTIGKAARESGLSSDTIRYYERMQLLQCSRRSKGGYRLYDDRALQRLRLIGRARSIGFSLEEIRLLFARRSGGGECLNVRDLLAQKIDELDQRILGMVRFRDALIDFRTRCDRALSRNARRCPILDDDDD
jgi:DNA-binding transcriptional MerR regulator